jgi:hypothetical protein
MPPDLAPGVTGSLRYIDSDAVVIGRWLGELGTGDEYGGPFVVAKLSLADMWGIHLQELVTAFPPAETTTDNSLQSRAAAIARRVPAVAVKRPLVPQLTGDLLEDARVTTGLTLGQIAQAIRVSERAVASWRAGTLPAHRREFFQRLRSIGLSLVGGLGPSGVQRWLLAGTPTRLERLAAGELEQVVAEARAYETSPAT